MNRINTYRPARSAYPEILVGSVILGTGLGLWWASLPSISFDRMTDTGIASVMPMTTWVGLTLVGLSFWIALRSRWEPLILASIAATIISLTGLAVIAEPTMRFVVAWRHVGVADYIRQHGAIDPHIDAYFNWPGFFTFIAFLWQTSGLRSIVPIAKYVPLVYDFMYLPPLVVIGDAVFVDRSLVWAGIWLFYVNNWIGQDYFSPQGLCFFLLLVVLAILLRSFKRNGSVAEAALNLPIRLFDRWRRGSKSPVTIAIDAPSTQDERVFLFVVVLLVVAAIVASHQLTPFAIILATGGLAITGWCRLRRLPVIMLLMTLLWLGYMAAIYLRGHLGALLTQAGSLSASLGESVGSRLHGSPGHHTIVLIRLTIIAFIGALALIGSIRRIRARKPALPFVVLAAAPIPLAFVQPYGGEVVLRIGLFAMPFLTFLAAPAILPDGSSSIAWHTALVGVVVGGIFVAAFPFTRYGNERMDYYSPEEVTAVHALYRMAPPSSLLVAASDALPWRYTGYASYEYRLLTGLDRHVVATNGVPHNKDVSIDIGSADRSLLIRQVMARMEVRTGQPSFLIITKSQEADLAMMSPWAPGALARLVTILRSSATFRVAFENADAIIFVPATQPPS
jgi:hypothetical protein